jgi:hypothetical protein
MAVVVSAYGGGVNSTAKLIGIVERNDPRPDLILFADTGSEHPETEEYVRSFSEWCVAHGLPPILVVKWIRKDGSFESIEDNCLRLKMLPSIAYGHKGCSVKWKRQPQDKYVASWQPAIDAWARGEKVVKLLGYDAGEPQRAKIRDDALYAYDYPLIRWGWGREECENAIRRAGLQVPAKSSCFFCPSKKKREVLEMRKRPDLLQRSLALEANADLTDISGLGRSYAWRDLIRADENQVKLFPKDSLVDEPCGCYDGGDE